MEHKPLIRILSGPTDLQQVNQLASAPWASMGAALSEAADVMPQDREDLHVFLHNRVALTLVARGRQTWALGRLYNRLAGDDPDYVTLSGVHLRQTLQVVGRAVPEIITARGEYKLRLDVVQEAVERLKSEG